MAKNKTAENDTDVYAFVEAFAEDEAKRSDSFVLIELMQRITGFAPKMWGSSIIGFGSYRYKYASGHQGAAPLLGFSPRKAAISLYIYEQEAGQDELLKGLGKFKMGKSCIYVKKLSDIHMEVLESLMQHCLIHLQQKYRDE